MIVINSKNQYGNKMIKIKEILLEAMLGFILWTLFLTPYMIIVVKTTSSQYISWLGMQAILIPIIAPIVFRITNKLKKVNND